MMGRRGRQKGTPKTGGRKAGTPNKATADIKALAQQHVPAAVEELARLAMKAESEQARVSAIKELFDRAYGRPSQAMTHSGTVGTYDAARLAGLSDEELMAFEAILARIAPGAAPAVGGEGGDREA